MIMPSGQQLLLPARPAFIWGSLMGAMALNMLGNIALWGRAPWAPDLLAICLLFWCVHQPQRIGLGAAFAFGLLMDVHQGSVLGQHALAYSVLNFLGILVHRRLLWFNLVAQSLHVLPLLAITHVVVLVVRLLVGGSFPGLGLLLAPMTEAALWPALTMLLLIPQRRAPDPDVHRPL